MTDDKIEERETLTVEVPLDPMHRRADLVLREQDVDVEQAISQAATLAVEQQLHDLVQEAKYQQ